MEPIKLANDNNTITDDDLFDDRAEIGELDGAVPCRQAVEDLRRPASVEEAGVGPEAVGWLMHGVPAG